MEIGLLPTSFANIEKFKLGLSKGIKMSMF